jgi:hypothetical protein
MPWVAKPFMNLLKEPNDTVVLLTANYPHMAVGLKQVQESMAVSVHNAILEQYKGLPASWKTLSDDQKQGLVSMIKDADASSVEELAKKYDVQCPADSIIPCLKVLQVMMSGHGSMKDSAYSGVKKYSQASAAATRHSTMVMGWNEMPGYKPVDMSGGFHNAWLTSHHYRTWDRGGMDAVFAQAKKDHKNIKGVIMESTEQATNGNDIRKDYHVPTWDFSTMGNCLAEAARAEDFDESKAVILAAVFESQTFQNCLTRWTEKTDYGNMKHLETKFGRQLDDSFKWYESVPKDDGNPSSRETLTCSGGRAGNPPIGRRMEDFDLGIGQEGKRISKACETTAVCMCHGEEQLTVKCDKPCPGSANCGDTIERAPCGIAGELCVTSEGDVVDPDWEEKVKLNPDPVTGTCASELGLAVGDETWNTDNKPWQAQAFFTALKSKKAETAKEKTEKD